MVPFVVFILLVGVKYISNVGESTEKPFDIISVPLAAIGFGGLVYALSDIETLMAGSFVPIIVGVPPSSRSSRSCCGSSAWVNAIRLSWTCGFSLSQVLLLLSSSSW